MCEIRDHPAVCDGRMYVFIQQMLAKKITCVSNLNFDFRTCRQNSDTGEDNLCVELKFVHLWIPVSDFKTCRQNSDTGEDDLCDNLHLAFVPQCTSTSDFRTSRQNVDTGEDDLRVKTGF